MAKFLNKKEQVIDFKLTPYGKYKLSTGTFKPTYYSFLDTGILYDGAYAGLSERQNDVHKRIKEETQFLEGWTIFKEIENSVPPRTLAPITEDDLAYHDLAFLESHSSVEDYIAMGEHYKSVYGATTWSEFVATGAPAFVLESMTAEMVAGEADSHTGDPAMIRRFMLGMFGFAETGIMGHFDEDSMALLEEPTKDKFPIMDMAIGDARFDGEEQQAAPAWKIATLQGNILSSFDKDVYNMDQIPQIEVGLNYVKRVRDAGFVPDPDEVSELVATTGEFADGNVIELVLDDLVVYTEEVNTELLNENFDIEVFQVEKNGEDTPATAIIKCTNIPYPGDTITISDGAETVTFEFCYDPDPAACDSGCGFTEGNLPVIIGYGAAYSGGGRCAYSMYSLLGAILQKWVRIYVAGPPEVAATLQYIRYDNYRDDGSYGYPHNLRLDVPGTSRHDEYSWTGWDGASGTRLLVNDRNLRESGPNFWRKTNTSLSGSFTESAYWELTGFSGASIQTQTLKKKAFAKKEVQIVDGLMISPEPMSTNNTNITTSSVEYYFDAITDSSVNQQLACRGSEEFNKSSYFIDLDFDCEKEKTEALFYDIYGSEVGDPEICQ